MMMELMTKDSLAYKWAQRGIRVTQSVIATVWIYILPTLLSCWHCVKTLASNCRRYSLISNLERYVYHAWDSLCSAMTIEVISRPEPLGVSEIDSARHSSPSPILPVLRLNSVAMDELLATPTGSVSNNSEFLNSHCQYSSSQSDDCDSGLVLTDPDENELSSDDAIPNSSDNSRLLQEPYTNRRDSDSSDSSSSDGQEVDENENKETCNRLMKQVESMFSDEHLAKDGFLLKHVRRRSDGFVSLKLVAGLRKVKQISREFPVVLESLRKSTKLEVNHDGTKVRRVEPLTHFLKTLPTAGNKDKETKAAAVSSNGASSDSAQDDRATTSKNGQAQNQSNSYQHRRNQRNNSVISNGSSSGGSRNGSFSRSSGQHDCMYRNAMVFSPDDVPHVIRRRGASLPMPLIMPAGGHQFISAPPQLDGQKRNSMFLSPSTSPSDASMFPAPRPKSNSYCEGSGRRNSNGGMSLWLQRRMEATKTADAPTIICGAIRQPRGPDGTRGFASGYRNVLHAM